MMQKHGPQIGDTGPDFTLKDQGGEDVRLSDLRGKRVLLSFHPLAWTGVCARQMQALEAHRGTFESLSTIPLGLSVDTVPSKEAWADSLGIENVRLLSDFWPHGRVASLYGIFRESDGVSERANIVLDEQGKVVFSRLYEAGKLPDIEEILGVLRGLPAAGTAQPASR